MSKNKQLKVKMTNLSSLLLTRSEARNFLSKWMQFDDIILDFDQVPTVGQAFADEIFRVFKIKHPKINIVPINMNETVKFMIGRVEKI